MSAPDKHGWMPIETAPTNGIIADDGEGGEFEHGPDVLLADKWGSITVGAYESDRWFANEGGPFDPTHWQPLPKGPVSS